MKRRLLTIVFVAAVVVTVVPALFCHREYGSATYWNTKRLKINKTYKFKQFGPVQLELLQIDKVNKKCLFELSDPVSGKVVTNWIDLGNPVSFDPIKSAEKKPRFGVFLREIGDDTVIVELRWAEHVVKYRWGFR